MKKLIVLFFLFFSHNLNASFDLTLDNKIGHLVLQHLTDNDLKNTGSTCKRLLTLSEIEFEKRVPVKVFPPSYEYNATQCAARWRKLYFARAHIIRSAQDKVKKAVPFDELCLFVFSSEFKLIHNKELTDLPATWYFGSLARSHMSNEVVLFYLNHDILRSNKPIFVEKYIQSRQPNPGYMLTLDESDRSLIKDCLADETLMACRAEYASLLLQALNDERNSFELFCKGQRGQHELRANIHKFCPSEGLAAMEKARLERLKKFDISELCEQLDFMLSHLTEETFPDSNIEFLLGSSIKIFYKLGKYDEVAKYGASYTTLPQFGATLSQNVLDIIEESKNL